MSARVTVFPGSPYLGYAPCFAFGWTFQIPAGTKGWSRKNEAKNALKNGCWKHEPMPARVDRIVREGEE